VTATRRPKARVGPASAVFLAMTVRPSIEPSPPAPGRMLAPRFLHPMPPTKAVPPFESQRRARAPMTSYQNGRPAGGTVLATVTKSSALLGEGGLGAVYKQTASRNAFVA